MIWFLGVLILSTVLLWGYSQNDDSRDRESYPAFMGRHIGVFVGEVRNAIQKEKKEKDESSEDS